MAAKIKKIKKEVLPELGDGFDALTDAEVQESGIEVADDEVLVIARQAPQQPSEDKGDDKDREIQNLRSRLHTVNQESAERRIKNRELESRIATLESDLNKANTTLREYKTKEVKTDAAKLFSDYVKEKKLAFIDEGAEEDVREAVFSQVDWDKKVTKEVLQPLVDGVVEKKKYLTKKATLPSTDGGRQSSVPDGTIDIDLGEIASEFGIGYTPPKQEGAQ